MNRIHQVVVKQRNIVHTYRDCGIQDIPAMWTINEQGLPGTGKVSETEIAYLMDISELCLGAFHDESLIGFVICLLPNKDYGSLNYSWFNQRYDDFIYVDRIAIAKHHRNNGIGTELYEKVIQYSNEKQIPITAEVSLDPPNEGSDRFHLRHSFKYVGEFHQEKKSVTMYIRDFSEE